MTYSRGNSSVGIICASEFSAVSISYFFTLGIQF